MTNTEHTDETNYKAFLEESAQDLYENAPCGYISTLPDGTIVKLNNTFLKWTGYQREEMLSGKKFQDLLSIGGKIFYETHHAPLIQMQGFVNELAYDIMRKDRTTLPVLTNATQVTDASGTAVLTRITLFNSTDRRKYELELLQAKRKAEQAAKVKAEFLSTVSHEIRTPMNAIIGITNLLLESDPKQEQLEFLNILRFSSTNLLNLINDILDFSKIESGKISLEEKTFHIQELVQTVLYSLHLKAQEKGITFYAHLDPTLPEYVISDPVKLGQILTNLVGNAIKFTDGGSITIELRAKELTATNVTIEFAVIDTGIGIAQDQLERIFEEFGQANHDTNRMYGGTGLGLTISQRLLHLFGSKMKVESELGKGSKFYFTLTFTHSAHPSPLHKAGGEAIESTTSIQGVKVLVVDDNAVNRFVVSQYLTKWGVLVDVAENGVIAVDKIVLNSYDLVLMDLQMPEMSGYEATRKIRSFPEEKYQTLPIIALSASTKVGLQERIGPIGMNDFVGKPFHPQELFAKIALYSKPTANGAALSAFSIQEASSPSHSRLQSGIRLDRYVELTKNKKDRLTELITITIEDFTEFKAGFIKALRVRNQAEFDNVAHKSKMTANLLEARLLLALVNQGTELLRTTAATDEAIQKLVYAIEQEIDVIIRELQKALS